MQKNNNKIPTFYKNELSKMNCSYPWTGAIKLFDDKSYNEQDKPYSLHPTGFADSYNGRQYIALPANLKITPDIKKQYNLL